jgi:hypothetical protein
VHAKGNGRKASPLGSDGITISCSPTPAKRPYRHLATLSQNPCCAVAILPFAAFPLSNPLALCYRMRVPDSPNERRSAPRITLEQMVRIRPFDPALPPEYCTVFNASSSGLFFFTSAGHYSEGMQVYVTTDSQPGSPINQATRGVVVRVQPLEAGRFGVAIHLV